MRILLLATLFAAACTPSSRDETSVGGAVVTLPAVAGRPGAAYFTIRAADGEGALRGVTSPAFARGELHEPGMRAVNSIPLPPEEVVAFAPGGRHVMLFGLDPALRAGARIPITLTFAGGAPVTVEAEVRAPGDVPMPRRH